PDPLLNVADDAGQVAALRVAADDDPAPCVLAVDGVGADARADVGQLPQLHLAPVPRQVNPQLAELGVIGPVRLFQAYHQVETPLSVQHLGDRLALQGGLQDLGDVGPANAVVRQVVGPQTDMQFVGHLDRLHDGRCHPRHGLNGGPDPFGRLPQVVEV